MINVPLSFSMTEVINLHFVANQSIIPLPIVEREVFIKLTQQNYHNFMMI
jgi:hypothetical protein